MKKRMYKNQQQIKYNDGKVTAIYKNNSPNGAC